MSRKNLLVSTQLPRSNEDLSQLRPDMFLDARHIMKEILFTYSCERYYHMSRDPTLGREINRRYRALLYGDGEGSLCVARMEYEYLKACNQERNIEGLWKELNQLKEQLETLFNEIYRKEKKHYEKNC